MHNRAAAFVVWLFGDVQVSVGAQDLAVIMFFSFVEAMYRQFRKEIRG